MEQNALIIGAGKVGRGFLGQLMTLNGYHLNFAEVDKDLVKSMLGHGEYISHILGDSSLDTVIRGYSVCCLDEAGKFNKTFSHSSLIFTSVGGKHLKDLSLPLAKAIDHWQKSADADQIKNIITCENWKDPAKDLKEALTEALLTMSWQKKKVEQLLSRRLGITEGVIMRTVVQPSNEQLHSYPLDTWGQNFWELPVDKARMLGNIPKLSYLSFISHFGRFLEQKLYTNNTSNAAAAYLGYLKGYTYTADAANDPQIEAVMDGVYQEVSKMLEKEFSVDPEEQEAFAAKAKKKYQDKIIVDPLFRHAADPLRKLGPDDRLISPARLALKNGIEPKHIITVIKAALYYDYEKDPSAVKLKKLRLDKGIPAVLKEVCGLNEEEVLYKMIMDRF